MKIGMGQMLVEGGEPERNLVRAEEMIRRAAEAGCEMVVLPECLDLGWTWPEARKLAEAIPGKWSERLATAAKRWGVWVTAGLTERDGDKVFNAAVLLSNRGEVVLKHRKISELNIGHDLYAMGDRLMTASTPLGRIGMTICADNGPGSLTLGHSLGRMGAELLVSPCAWAVDADHDNSKAPYGEMWRTCYSHLASLYDMTIVGVSNVGWITGGPWKGKKCIGNSMAVGPGGEVLATAPHGVDAECLIVVEAAPAPSLARQEGFAETLRQRGYSES